MQVGALIGIDGCRGGWVGALDIDGALTWRTAPNGDITSLLNDVDIAAIDIPIGLVDHGWRECDHLAKAALGSAGSRVFMTPPRSVIELGLTAPNDLVQERSRALTGQGVSRQALALSSRILEVDALLPDARLIEVHPELSFASMAGRVLTSKHTAEGLTERIDALRTWRSDIDELLVHRPERVPMNDCLDALACLWTAARFRDGEARGRPPVAAPSIVT